MAACYVGGLREVQPHGPYFLVGYSAGGLVAFEMARQLHADGQEVGLVGLLDAFGGNHYSLALPSRLVRWGRFQLRRIKRHTRAFAQARGWEKLGYLGQKSRSRLRRMTDSPHARAAADEDQTPPAVRNVQESAELAETRYVPLVYPGRLTLFRAAEQPPTFDQVPEEGWKEIAAGGVDIRHVPGTHYTMLAEPNVAALAQELKVRMHAALPAIRQRPAGQPTLRARRVELTS
jgi:aspartate racemase